MDDDEIISLYLHRDEQALQETQRSYGGRLLHLSQRILENSQDAQECVNDTYLAAWNTIPPKCPRFFYAYLASICRNLSFNRLDWNLARKRKGELVALTQEMETCIPDRGWQMEAESRELRRVLEAFLETLGKESRLIFLRRYLYLDTVEEIARRYGISQSKVKTQLHRTREKLRKYLNKEGISL